MEERWFYTSYGTQAGPISRDELATLAANGKLVRSAFVWRDGLADWLPAETLDGLFTREADQPQQDQPDAVPLAVVQKPSTPAVPLVLPPAVLPYVGGGDSAQDEGVSLRTIDILRRTRPWVLMFSVLLFIGASLFALGGLAIFGVSAASGYGTRSSGLGIAGGVLSVFYLAMAAFMFIPALSLARFASRIRKLSASGQLLDLEAALDAQRSYWRFLGILTCVLVGLNIATFVIALIISIAS